MAMLRLLRATASNGIFTRLKTEWDRELETEEAPPVDLYNTMMGHAADILERRDGDRHYGIWSVVHCEDGTEDDQAPYEAFVHIAHKLPNTSDATLNVMWSLFAPRYDFAEPDPADIARIMAAIVGGAFDLSKTHMPLHQVKMYLGNMIDRQFALAAGMYLATIDASRFRLPFAAVGFILSLADGPRERGAMDTKGLEKDLYAAFLHAAAQMGARVKGMSCFVRNWGAVKPLAEALSPKSEGDLPKAA